MTITRRTALTGGVAAMAATIAPASGSGALAATPGVTAHSVKIGNTSPYSGPASAYGVLGHLESAFFKMVNETGGIAGHKIDFISLDDGYSPPKTVEDVRRLVEQEKVDFLFATLGTPTNSAIEKYCNHKKVPQLFVATGADKWGNYKQFPWTMGWQPSYRAEAQIYTKYMLKHKPNAKLGILYQNDDFGKDYPAGVRDILGANWGKHVVKSLSYEVTDPTVDSQITELQAAGADTLLVAATPKFAAQSIRKVHSLNWKPMFFMTNVSISVGSVIRPAGEQNAVGMLSGLYLKDSTDPAWDNDAGMKEFRAFMAKYLPHGDVTDGGYIAAYGLCYTMRQVLEQCKGNFSRANVMKQAANLHHLKVPVLLPGIEVNTSPTNYHPTKAMQLASWNGSTWKRFGEVIEGI
ncbi:MAG: ABC transporter substrate-binding protein [Rhodospirillales bacterium]|nr:ABC transporter substrate-binding protein [Rhodospirillales bacterium]